MVRKTFMADLFVLSQEHDEVAGSEAVFASGGVLFLAGKRTGGKSKVNGISGTTSGARGVHAVGRSHAN